jgi:hypothetical protein
MEKRIRMCMPCSWHLTGDWEGSGTWSDEGGSDTFRFDQTIVQKGTSITIINKSHETNGNIKDNVLYLEPSSFSNPENDVRIFLPSRQCKISEDGNTITCNFDYIWDNDKDRGNGTMVTTSTRK